VIAALVLACALLLMPVPATAAPAPANGPPSLVVVFVLDMAPPGVLDRAEPLLTGGLGRMLRSGRRYTQCRHDHAGTETGPGHATLLSGLYPSHSGIILNDWYDRATKSDVYCAGDSGPGARPDFDDPASHPIGPGNLRGENLADLVKRKIPGAKVYAVAGKDRAAVLMGGHHPDGAFWHSRSSGWMTSNPSLIAALPSWGAAFWGDTGRGVPYTEGIPDQWTYPLRPGARADDYPYENAVFSRVSPHPLLEPTPTGDKATATIVNRIIFSPWWNWPIIGLSRRILEAESLGADAAPDLLLVGLSATDSVGHHYGPDSQEYLDTLIRVDGWMDDLMRDARSRAEAEGRGGVLFALSGDHGVLPLPETIPGARRIDAWNLRSRMRDALASAIGKEGAQDLIASVNSGNIYFDGEVLARLDMTADQAAEAARRAFSGFWEIARVYKASDLAGSSTGDQFLDLQRHSFDAERGGDVVVQPCDRCLVTSSGGGTSHGSPYDYDRHVPMILMGDGIEPGEDDRECHTVDLAPTIAELLGISFDTPRDGRSLAPRSRAAAGPAGRAGEGH